MPILPPPDHPLSLRELLTLDVGEGLNPRDVQKLLLTDPENLTDYGRELQRMAREAGWR